VLICVYGGFAYSNTATQLAGIKHALPAGATVDAVTTSSTTVMTSSGPTAEGK